MDTKFNVGDLVKWIPTEAKGDMNDPVCLEGLVTGVAPNGIRTVVWWGGEADNQSAADSRTLVRVSKADHITSQLPAITWSQLMEIKAHAGLLVQDMIGPRLWWLHEVDNPASGAVWTREPDADDIAFVENESKRKHAVKRLVPV